MNAQRSPGCLARRRIGRNERSGMLIPVSDHDVIDVLSRGIKGVRLGDQEKPLILRRRIVAYEVMPVWHCVPPIACYRAGAPMTGIFRISIIEAHVGVKAITDCMLTEMARQIMLARACCRQDSPSAKKESRSDRTLRPNEKSQTERPAIVMLDLLPAILR